MSLKFAPLKKEDYPAAYRFLRDSFTITFGPEISYWARQLRDLTEEQYFEALEERTQKNQSSVTHVWIHSELIGQIELSQSKENPSEGFVDLLYLIPEKRGIGHGRELEQFTVREFLNWGCRTIKLNVEKSNLRAIGFYEKCGWRIVGENSAYAKAWIMEKEIAVDQ